MELKMGKKKYKGKNNGRGKVIGLAGNYLNGNSPRPYLLFELNGKKYLPYGQTKNLRDLTLNICRGSCTQITPLAKQHILGNCKSPELSKLIRKLNVVMI